MNKYNENKKKGEKLNLILTNKKKLKYPKN